mmetsp:Transcript_210/g.207  ORF Transcript_210/g.207 Transcript_210/m.207 type:complete len:123 (-) Transcript_210:67-435(-)
MNLSTGHLTIKNAETNYPTGTFFYVYVCRLNQEVMQGFVKLVHELVHRPLDNKKCRDELSHNIFLMLQECNKFREHQAREVLIETLEKQLAERHMALAELQKQIKIAEDEIERVEEAAPMLI